MFEEEMAENEREQEGNGPADIAKSGPLLHILLFAILIAAIVATYEGFRVISLNKAEDLGNLGSYLQGSTGALLSLAALFFLYFQLKAQSAQIKLQQKEVARAIMGSREESAKASKQLQMLQLQLAEDRFCHFLTAHLSTISHLTLNEKTEHLSGREVFSWIADQFRQCYGSSDIQDPRQRAIHSAKHILLRYEFILSAYLNSFKFLLQYTQLHLRGLPLFVECLRGHLSTDELFLLYYLIPAEIGIDSSWPEVVKKTDIYRNMNALLLLDPSHTIFDYAK